MRKLTAGLLLAFSLGMTFSSVEVKGPVCMAQKAEIDVQEEANILYEEALELKKQGSLERAIEAYHQAMRKDRAILAYDDAGLIEDLKNDCEKKLEANPEDVKTIETLAFVNAVCYSDYKAAIEYYQKVVELVDDESVKDRTNTLIARLKATSEAQQQFQTEIASQMREERLKSWSEMERADRFGQETAEAQEKARQLAEMYKAKDSLKNRVPQLEQELKDLNEEYDKANRLWYSLKDDLYYRKRRRLKDDIAAKEQELAEAREELEEVESTTSDLERQVQIQEQAQQASPVKTYDNYQGPTDSGSAGSTGAVAPPANDYGAPPDDSGSSAGEDDDIPLEEPLPPVENPDFPSDDETPAEREKRLQELINDL
jgi:tetratricopeptide (TPR) repeat protein